MSKRIALAAASLVIALSVLPSVSQAHGRRHHHKHHGVAVAAGAAVAADCFLTRMADRVGGWLHHKR